MRSVIVWLFRTIALGLMVVGTSSAYAVVLMAEKSQPWPERVLFAGTVIFCWAAAGLGLYLLLVTFRE